MKRPVAGYDNLYKDEETGLIVNRQTIDRERYKILKKQSIDNMNAQYEIASMKEQIDEIKSLLQQILNK